MHQVERFNNQQPTNNPIEAAVALHPLTRASNRYVLAVFWYGDFKNVWKYGLLKKKYGSKLAKNYGCQNSVDFVNPLKFVIAAAVLPVSAHGP